MKNRGHVGRLRGNWDQRLRTYPYDTTYREEWTNRKLGREPMTNEVVHRLVTLIFCLSGIVACFCLIQNHLFKYLQCLFVKLFYSLLLCVQYVCRDVEVRGQLCEFSSFLPPSIWVLRIKAGLSVLHSKCLYPLIHLTGPPLALLKTFQFLSEIQIDHNRAHNFSLTY